MKKTITHICTVLVAILFANNLFAQTISSVSPTSGNQGATLPITITGSGITFSQASSCMCPSCIQINSASPTIVFEQGSSVIGPFGFSSITGGTVINTNINIPSTAAAGYYNVWIYNLGLTCSVMGTGKFRVGAVGINDVTALNDFYIAPNPGKGNFILEWNNSSWNGSISTAEVYGVDGRKINSFNIVSGKNNLDLSTIPAGIYFVSVRNEGIIIGTRKLIIQ